MGLHSLFCNEVQRPANRTLYSRRWRSDSNGYPHIFDHAQLRYYTADTAWHRQLKCRPRNRKSKPEVEITFERKQMGKRFKRLPPHFRPCPTRIWHCRHCPTSADIGSPQSELIISFGLVADVWSFRCRSLSGRVRSAISKSGMVENVGVAAGIASPSVSVQQLFPLPFSTSGFVTDVWVSNVARCRVVSAVSYLCRAWSKMWG